MRSRAALGGHPIHPMLVPIPIGLFVWTLVADIVYLATGKEQMWYDIAFWSGIAAWISALVAALPGFVDFLLMAVRSDARDLAVYHMLMNVTIVALYFVAMMLMLDNNAVDGGALTGVVVLHAIGSGMLLVSGWIGGEMVFRHHLAIVPDNSELEQAEITQHADLRGARGMRGM